MAFIYDNFSIKTKQLLDDRSMVKSIIDLYGIKHPCEGLLCWVSSADQYFVYKEDIQDWIPMPVVIPYDVKHPVNGSVKIDEQSKVMLTYHNGEWYDCFGREFESKNDYFYSSSNFDKVINTSNGFSLQEIIDDIYSRLSGIGETDVELLGTESGAFLITEDGYYIEA